MTRRPATWKVVTFGAALTGLGAAGVGIATASDDRTEPLPAGVSVAAHTDSPADASADRPAPEFPADLSPESADSPDESVTHTPDVAPAAAAADVPRVDVSPDTADTPDVQTADSPDRGDD